MLRLILGRAGTGKTALILGELNERVRAGQDGGWLIVPEQYSHEAERELAARCGDSACLYAEVVSFTRLAHRVALRAGGSARTYIDRGGRLLQLALALDQIGSSLEVYGSAARRPEMMSPLLTALDELRFGRADAQALRAAAEELDGPLAAKLRDLAMIREALDAQEARTGADPSSRLDILAEQIPGCGMFAGGSVYIDGFTDFTAQERQVIRALWNSGADVTVALTCDMSEEDSEVFSSARRTARMLSGSAAEDGVEVRRLNVLSRGTDNAMGFLDAHLFSWTGEVFPAGDSVRLFTAPGVTEECELAAAEALRLVREQGCRWRDIAVAVRGFEDYRGALADAFRRYGVPLYATARTDIFTRPLPALMGAAFDLLSDGWSYESMFTYLKCGLAGISREECDALENYALTWEIRGTAWTREAAWRQHPDGYNAEPTPESEARLAELDALRRRVAAPLERFARRGKLASTALEQCRAVADFWEDIDLAGRLTERAGALER
ncbi:MAG: ATP-dependent nuclease subunit B, partial [Clostridia bacterium]|nr:ATP-dependent nuclease subunit B [Clostridia bacterium]